MSNRLDFGAFEFEIKLETLTLQRCLAGSKVSLTPKIIQTAVEGLGVNLIQPSKLTDVV